MTYSIFRCARVLALIGLVFCARAQAAPDVVEATTEALQEVVPGEYNGDVRDLPPVYTPRPYLLLNEFEAPMHLKSGAGAGPVAPSEAPGVALAPMPAPTKNFAGLAFDTSVSGGQAGGGWPPDTNGDVGPTYYIQSVNTAFGIFSKSNGALAASFTEDQLWSAATAISGPCKTANAGDPVVLHDAINDRWILTNFAFAFSGGNPVSPFYQCIAVSKTGDPVAGGWWFYAIRMDAGNVPANTLADYPKFGLWGDGCLYMGANGFDNSSGNYAGAIFASFNTANMYAGAALASSIGYLAADPTTGEPFGMFPANALGATASALPSASTPEYFVNESGTAFAFNVRKFTKGANCGAGGTLGAAIAVAQAGYGYPAVRSGGTYTVDMIPQSGTTNLLDSLGDRIMQKVQYRKIGTAESLWVVHTTCGSMQDPNGYCAATTSGTAQPQWAQINVTGGSVSTAPVQQQIYAPDTTKSRWMGSLAVDASGDMALSYSTSSSTAFPSIAYSGRLFADASNQLPQTEASLVTGGGSQTLKISGNFVTRWGDYSSMSVDPSDDCTFWYTNEYYDTAAHGSSGTWQTRIGAFKFPSCTSAVVPTKLVVTQQPSASYASGATITLKVSVENAAGAVVTTDTSAIAIALQGGTAGATLSGTTTVNAVAGVATFSLSVDKIGTAYKLHATDGSLTAADSSAFNITVGTATAVTFTIQPAANSNVAAGATIPLVAHVTDAGGNPVSGQSVKLAFGSNPGGSTLAIANPISTNVNGDATFNSLSLTKVGTGYTFTATDNSAPSSIPATSNAFNIVAAAPFGVSFSVQPSTGQNVVAGSTIALAALVTDAWANPIVGDNVTLAIANNAGSATLSAASNPVATDSSGTATFGNVSLDKAGTGYTLKATESTGLHSVTGNAFNIVAGAAAKLVFTTQPANVAQGGTLNTIAVTEQDALGNTIASDSSSSVSFSVSACGGAVLGNATMNSGVATLPGTQVFTQDRFGLTIGASDASLNATSQKFNVGPVDGIFIDGYEDCAL